MLHIRIPHPKHELEEYTTERLFAWLEDCTAIETLYIRDAGVEGLVFPPTWCQYHKASRMKRAIWQQLIERGEPVSRVSTKVRNTKMDVLS